MDKIFEWLLPIKKDDGMVLRGIRCGETAPIVRMHLIDDGGKGADITGVDAVSVTVERSDGMKVALTLSTQSVLCFSPAVVELSFADARLSAVAGLCTGVIDCYSGDVRMTSARFRYNVEPGIEVSDDEVAKDPEYSMFVGAMTDLARLNEEVSQAESARSVFEYFDPYKTYVKGNKVVFEGSSYILVADRAVGANPTDDGVWLCIAERGDKGEQGDKGDKGAQGDTGAKGAKGDTGAKGDKGDPGAKGENGDKGEQGIQGEKGDKGDPGADGKDGSDANVDPDTMVYRGEVAELPETANENEVYTVSSWEKKGTYSDVSSFTLSSNIVSFSAWDGLPSFLYENVQSDYGCSYKFVVDGSTYVYTDCGVNGVGDWGFDMNGTTKDVSSSISVSGATVELYYAPAGKAIIENKSYVFYNGEWLEIYDDSEVLAKIANLESGKANAAHNHSASNITSGILSVSRGGTGKGSWSANRLIYPSGSTTISQLAFPTEKSVLAQDTSGAPYWVKMSELGGGSASGAMVFKGVVDALPTSASENEVYVLKGAKSTTVTYDGLYSRPTVTSTSITAGGGYEAHEWLMGIVDDIDFVDGGNIYISVNGNCYVLQNATTSYDYDDGAYTANLYYSQNDEIVQALDGVDSFVASANTPNGTYIYSDGEWVEL